MCATCFSPTWSISWRIVEEAEAEHQEDKRSPGDFAQQLQAAYSSPLHGSKGQHHWRPNNKDKPGTNTGATQLKYSMYICAYSNTHAYENTQTYHGMTRSATVRPGKCRDKYQKIHRYSNLMPLQRVHSSCPFLISTIQNLPKLIKNNVMSLKHCFAH